MPRSRSVDPALAREAAITKQLIEPSKEERPLTRISRWDVYNYIHGVFITVPLIFSTKMKKKRVKQGGDIDILVSDTVGTQESRKDPATGLYLVHPSGNS